MAKFLVLEDDPARIAQFRKRFAEYGDRWATQCTARFVDSVAGFMMALHREEFDYTFLDHDLDGRVYVPSEEQNTGAEAARRIVAEGLLPKCGRVFVHSFNQSGAEVMTDLLRCPYVPGVWLRDGFHNTISPGAEVLNHGNG